jgi:hypothetical protein
LVGVLRWILVIPTGVVCAALGVLSNALGLLAFGFLISLPNSGGWGIVITLVILGPAIGFIIGCLVAAGAAPVMGPAYMAPRGREIVAIVAATLFIGLVVIGTVMNIGSGTSLLIAIGNAVFNVAGAIYGASEMRKRAAVTPVALGEPVVA